MQALPPPGSPPARDTGPSRRRASRLAPWWARPLWRRGSPPPRWLVWSRRHRGLTRLAVAAAALLVLGVAGLTVGPLYLEAAVGPPPPPRALAADSLLTDRSGNPIADVHQPGAHRIPVPLGQVSPYFREAIVAVEDHGFWSEGAIDPVRIAEAAWTDLRAGSASQGASTIPMQLAKLLYLTDNRSLLYKIREVAYAGDLTRALSRSQILDDYVNDIPFGSGATGVEAAAEIYFGVHASQLDLAEAALLAGLPQAPSAYDPLANPSAARARQRLVLQAMVRYGDITAGQAAAAAAETLHHPPADPLDRNLYPDFVARVCQEVSSTLHADCATAGLRITTTLDSSLQARAQSTVTSRIEALAGINITDGALVSIDPGNGQVLAYVGSAGPGVPGADYDMAAVPRQVGSSFKLYTYPTALAERKISMLTPVLDGPIAVPLGNGRVYSPSDYNLTWHGIVPVAVALGSSLNVPAVRVEMLAGIPNVVAMARRMGVTTLTQPASSYGPSLTLGTYPVPLWEMAQAATAYADQGVMHNAEFILRVTDDSGQTLDQPESTGTRVMDPGVAFIMNQILSNNANRLLAFGADSPLVVSGHVVAVKTGTSQDFKDILSVGWTPALVTATWVGNTDDSPIQSTNGIIGAASIWNSVMTAALQGQQDNWPGPPSDVVREAATGPAPAAGGAGPQGAPGDPGAGPGGGPGNGHGGPGNGHGGPGNGHDGPGGGSVPTGSAYLDAAGGQPAWFLTGTSPSTGAAQLTGEALGQAADAGTSGVTYSGGCRYWTYQGIHYWACGTPMSGLPGDPGPQPPGQGTPAPSPPSSPSPSSPSPPSSPAPGPSPSGQGSG